MIIRGQRHLLDTGSLFQIWSFKLFLTVADFRLLRRCEITSGLCRLKSFEIGKKLKFLVYFFTEVKASKLKFQNVYENILIALVCLTGGWIRTRTWEELGEQSPALGRWVHWSPWASLPPSCSPVGTFSLSVLIAASFLTRKMFV